MLLRPPLSASRSLPTPSLCPAYRSSIRYRLVQSSNFSTSSLLSNKPPPNHYEILQVSPTVSAAELKKQFYVLSKETHPDIRRDDPKAGERFAQISESYSVLADPAKRKKYDREVLHLHSARSVSSSSTGGSFAGSRAPTGLSKRRSVFRGPPPSYFSHGKQTQGTSSSSPDYQPGTFDAGSYTTSGRTDSMFDARPVYRTQAHEDQRRESRRAAAMAQAITDFEDDSDFWARFVIVSSIVVFGVMLAGLVATRNGPKKGGLVRADGSRRDSPTPTKRDSIKDK